MDPTRTQRYGKHYYRNNYVPSNSRQALEDRLHPPGISTSSNSSWTFSNSHDIPKHKKGRLCGIFLIGAVMFVALAVIAIGGLAFYIGGHSTDKQQNVRKYPTKETIGAKRQYSDRETETTNSHFSSNATSATTTTQSLLETSSTESNQTKAIPSGAILGLSDTMKSFNDDVKNKRKEETTIAVEMETEMEVVPETFTEVVYKTERSSFPSLTTEDVEILPKIPSTAQETNFSEGKKFVAIANSSTKSEGIQNGHARPTYSGPVPSSTVTTISPGLFPPRRDYADEPWRPIIPSYREPVRIEHPYEQLPEKVFQHRYGPTEEYIIDNDSPITFSRKSYEQNLGISSDFKGNGGKFKKPQSSRIADELTLKYKDLITKEGLQASVGIGEVVVRSDDVVTFPPRKSADVIILGDLSTASTLTASYNANKIIKTNEGSSREEEHTFKIPHNVQSYIVAEESGEVEDSAEITTRRTSVTPATFKAILTVTSNVPDKSGFADAGGALQESDAVPIKNESDVKTFVWKEAVTAEILKTTARSEVLTSAEPSSKGTTEVKEPSASSTTEVIITSTTPAANSQQNKIIKNPFADDSRSSSSNFNFGIPDLPILKQFQNLDSFLKSVGNASNEKNATDMSKYFVKNDENPDKIITRFPVRTKPTTPKSYKKEDFYPPVEMSTPETTTKSNQVYGKPVVIRGEVEVISGSLKDGLPRATTEIPRLITLLPVRSNVNMMKPLRPRPKSNINSTIIITDRRKPKMNSEFSAAKNLTNGRPKVYYSVPFRERLTESDSHLVYDSSSGSRDVPEKEEKLYIVTPEPKNPGSNVSTEEIFSHFSQENLSSLPLYNTIEALLNVDSRDRGGGNGKDVPGGKTRENLKEPPTKRNTSEIVKQIMKVVDNVVISSGDLPKILVKVNQTMVNKTTTDEDNRDKNISRGSSSSSSQTTKLFSSNYKLNQAGVPILTKILHRISSEEEVGNETSKLVKTHEDCRNDSFVCGNGVCLSPSKKCDQVVDCKDGSDEKNCTCAERLASQKLQRKLCDGVVDCWDFSDEFNCEWCKEEFICSHSRMCIKKSQVCDGKNDCPYGDDERNCVTVSPNNVEAETFNYHNKGYLMIRKNGKWGKLCIDNFDAVTLQAKTGWKISDLGRSVCRALTFKDFDKVERMISVPNEGRFVESGEPEKYYELAYYSNISSSDSRLSFNETTCGKREVIRVTCTNLECGLRPQANKQWSRIVGGGNAGPGSWPWQAALYREGEFQCGGTLISENWLISAGHCYYRHLEAYWVARLGILRTTLLLPSPYEQLRQISKIILHPQYVDIGFVNDISLLKMKDSVKFTDYVRPICLPKQEATIVDGALCTVVGWGQLSEVGWVFPDTLQEVQLPILSSNECRKRTLFLPLYKITDDMFCAGYDRGGRDACLGDSGGPLMCPEPDGKWVLTGITSNGYGCARSNRPGVYTRVSKYLKWLESQMILHSESSAADLKTHEDTAYSEKVEQLVKLISKKVINVKLNSDTRKTDSCSGHRCPLGECLPRRKLCNGRIECSDGSDEKDCW